MEDSNSTSMSLGTKELLKLMSAVDTVKPFLITFAVLGSAAILLNAAIIFVLLKHRRQKLKHVFYILILNFGIIDTLRGACLLIWSLRILAPTRGVHFSTRLAWMKVDQVALLFLRFTFLATILNLLIITLNEYLFIQYSLYYHRYVNARRAVLVVAATWLLSILFIVGSALARDVKPPIISNVTLVDESEVTNFHNGSIDNSILNKPLSTTESPIFEIDALESLTTMYFPSSRPLTRLSRKVASNSAASSSDQESSERTQADKAADTLKLLLALSGGLENNDETGDNLPKIFPQHRPGRRRSRFHIVARSDKGNSDSNANPVKIQQIFSLTLLAFCTATLAVVIACYLHFFIVIRRIHKQEDDIRRSAMSARSNNTIINANDRYSGGQKYEPGRTPILPKHSFASTASNENGESEPYCELLQGNNQIPSSNIRPSKRVNNKWIDRKNSEIRGENSCSKREDSTQLSPEGEYNPANGAINSQSAKSKPGVKYQLSHANVKNCRKRSLIPKRPSYKAVQFNRKPSNGEPSSQTEFRFQAIRHYKYAVVIGCVIAIYTLFLLTYSAVQVLNVVRLTRRSTQLSSGTVLLRFSLQLSFGIHAVLQPLCYFRMKQFRQLFVRTFFGGFIGEACGCSKFLPDTSATFNQQQPGEQRQEWRKQQMLSEMRQNGERISVPGKLTIQETSLANTTIPECDIETEAGENLSEHQILRVENEHGDEQNHSARDSSNLTNTVCNNLAPEENFEKHHELTHQAQENQQFYQTGQNYGEQVDNYQVCKCDTKHDTNRADRPTAVVVPIQKQRPKSKHPRICDPQQECLTNSSQEIQPNEENGLFQFKNIATVESHVATC